MSQSQPQQQQQQQQQISTKNKNKKRKKKRKRSDANVKEVCSINNNNLEITAGGTVIKEKNEKIEKKPLHSSLEQLQDAKPITPIVSRKAAGSNWEAVAKIQQEHCKNNEQDNVAAISKENISEPPPLSKSARHRQKRKAAEQKYVAMDCEMVGVGFNGQEDMLARVSIVNKRGEVLLDKFVKPQEAVTDYRTSVSGIRPHNIDTGEEFKSVQDEVVQLLQGKILVGHAVRNDLAVLHIKHPYNRIRDTARYKPLCRLVANGHTPSLKRLSQAILGLEIQTGEHNSVEDARAAMRIYNCLAGDWEKYIQRHQHKNGK